MNPWNILFPFQKYMKNFSSSSQSKDMEKYMANMFSNWQQSANNDDNGTSNESAFHSIFDQFSNEAQNNNELSAIHATVYETHSDIYIRFPIDEPEQLKKLKIYHTSNTSIIEGFPKDNDRHTITLPAIIKKKGGSAQFKEGILEIKLPKANDLQYSEINITEL
ncbi:MULTISPECIES: Hsp20/alpha crystallin family protein [Bacillus]|uniref:Hsp20/alpha crystallin family protein n=1 Tax=Bacillus TaxID=1386 RepID=UPI0002FFA53B|nr:MULTISPECIES: Hsp20/alpha crystallin family protein [Bacillus]